MLLIHGPAFAQLTGMVPVLDPFKEARQRLREIAPSPALWENGQPFLVCATTMPDPAVKAALHQLSGLLGTELPVQQQATGCQLTLTTLALHKAEDEPRLVLDVRPQCPRGSTTCALDLVVLRPTGLSGKDRTALTTAYDYLVDAGLLGVARPGER